MSEDLYTVDMMDAYSYLGSILGEDTDDDLADKIFSDFCMGK
jgi:tRNA modification GTPase